MKTDLDKLTEAERIGLNHRIIERLRFIQQAQAGFSMGDQVNFEPLRSHQSKIGNFR